MSLEVIPTGAALGAEISGVDLTKEIDAATFKQIKHAFYQHEVIFFRGNNLSPDNHVEFSARFGEVRKVKAVKGERFERPEVVTVSNIIEDGQFIGRYDAGRFWHVDGPYAKNPVAASALYAIEVPQKDGHALGATVFASMTAAYDALSPSVKKQIEGREALHSAIVRYEKTIHSGGTKDLDDVGKLNDGTKNIPEAVHPVVRMHPVTRRKCLYVTEGFTMRILGIPENESKDLLAELTAHCVQPQFLYTHSWREQDFLMWDQCATQHKATFDYALPLRRRMHRTVMNWPTSVAVG